MAESENHDANHFWKSIFEQEKLALRLAEIAAQPDGCVFHLPTYGSVKLTATKATKLGENFMSLTYYTTADLDNGLQRKAFVKILPDNRFLRAAAIDQKVYEREISSYYHYLPLLRQIRAEAGLSSADVPLNVPDIYYSKLDQLENEDGEDITVLVMEELNSQGFRMVDVQDGCTEEEARLTLSTLANYHALSIMLLRKYKNPDGSYSLPESLQYALKPVWFCEVVPTMVSKNMSKFIDLMKHFGHEEAALWLEEQSTKTQEAMGCEDISQCGPLSCILHGDCWNNNMLYRYRENGNEAIDVRLIDWQILLPGRPGRDVAHFLFTSAKSQLRREKGEQLLNHYVDTLLSALKKLGAGEDVLDHEQVMTEVKKEFLYGMFTGFNVLPAILDKSVVSKMEEIGNDETKQFGTDAAMDEIDEIGGDLTLDVLISNKELSTRLVDLVMEVKEILQ